LVNSAGGAFLTIQKAIDTVATLDIAGFTVTVQIADGTYTGVNVLKNVVGFAAAGNLVIQGNNATPANVVISTTSADAFSADGITSVWDIKDLKVQIAGVSGSGISANNGASVRYGNINFGACPTAHAFANLGATITAISNYAVSGAAVFHWYALNASKISANGLTVTITGTPAFTAWTQAQGVSAITCYGGTFSGSATGARYSATGNGYLFTNGAGATYLPGNAAGSTASGGQYL
jgi:hypothetical protein